MVAAVKRAVSDVVKACLKRRRFESPVPEAIKTNCDKSRPVCIEHEGFDCARDPSLGLCQYKPNRATLEGLPDDVLCKVFAWLSFQEVDSAMRTCRELYRLKSKRSMFRVLCQLRWPHNSRPAVGGGVAGNRGDADHIPPAPRDPVYRIATLGSLSSGSLPPFLVSAEWYKHLLARDILEQVHMEFEDPHNQILQLAMKVTTIMKSPHSQPELPLFIESIRWVVELWERATLIHGKDWDLRYPMSVSGKYNRAALRLIVESVQSKDRDTLLLSIKAIGILCRDERNRIKIGNSRGVETLVELLSSHLNDTMVLELDLWSLVHISRPVGGVEGESYDVEEHTDYDININRMWRAGCLEKCLRICETHRDSPSVLAKVFWLIVNLSLPEERKDVVLAAPIVKHAVEALRRFPDHWELNYRAIFSLVNVCCYMPVKSEFTRHRGFKYLNAAMARWPQNYTLQRTALNVVKGFTTLQVEDGLSAGEREENRSMFTVVCTAMRQFRVLDRIEATIELFDNTSEEECPGSASSADLARWMFELVTINAH